MFIEFTLNLKVLLSSSLADLGLDGLIKLLIFVKQLLNQLFVLNLIMINEDKFYQKLSFIQEKFIHGISELKNRTC